MESQADNCIYIRVDGQTQHLNYVPTVPKKGTAEKERCTREVEINPILSEIRRMAHANEEVEALLLGLANELISTRTIGHDHYITSKAAMEELKNIEVNRDHRSSSHISGLPPRTQTQPQAHALQSEARRPHVQQQYYTNGRGNAARYRTHATKSQHAAEPSGVLSNSGAQDPQFGEPHRTRAVLHGISNLMDSPARA
jgi:hypothetical protein